MSQEEDTFPDGLPQLGALTMQALRAGTAPLLEPIVISGSCAGTYQIYLW
jgi:hypothetical protein